METHYQITIVKYGTRQATKSDVFLNHHIYGDPDEPLGMDYFVWVVRNADRTVVVDTGFSRHGGAVRDRDVFLEPPAVFAALGVDPAQNPDVVITHAHYDHAGNLDHFPGSTVVIAAAELAFWTSPMGRRRQFHHSVEDADIEGLRTAVDQGRVRTFSGELELAPGIRVIEVGGHTPGQSILLVDTSDGTVVLASDSVHYYEELEADKPFAFVADLPAMYAGFDTVAGFLADGRASHVVTGHDPATLDRFTPVTEGPLAGLAATIGKLDTGDLEDAR